MASAIPARRVLVDLPVNTFGTPSGITAMGSKGIAGQKRSIREVDDSEMQQNISRLRASPARSESTTKAKTPREKINEGTSTSPETPSSHSASAAAHTPDLSEVPDEGDSQTSFKDSVFDADETIDSEHTAATEVTQPVRSRASQRVETLRLRLRLAQFKVRTNQIDIPFSRLRVSTEEPHNSPPTLPRLLAGPILQPTAYSARMIAQPQQPSSPPTTPSSPVHSPRSKIFGIPALPMQIADTVSQQTGSPPESPKRCKAGGTDESLTSSDVRGKAAVSLLGLRVGPC